MPASGSSSSSSSARLWSALNDPRRISALIGRTLPALAFVNPRLHNLKSRYSACVSLMIRSCSVINAMAAGLMAVDATCMALLAISASLWENTTAAARVDSAVMLLQLLALCGELYTSRRRWSEGERPSETLKGHRTPKGLLRASSPLLLVPR